MSPEKDKRDELDEAKEAAAAEGAAAPEAEAAPEEAASDEPTSGEPTSGEPAEDEPAAEAKPKRRRSARAKAAEEEPAEEEPAAEEATSDEPSAEAKPKRRRSARTKAAEEEPAGEATPAPARRRQPGEAADEDQLVVVRAQAKYVRTSARKARLVCDHIRGKDVDQARAVLSFTPRSAAKAWSKLLDSAVANAEHNHELVGDDLRIAAVYADEGPTLKRYRPKAMGRATRIRKRTAHLTIELMPKE